MDLAVKARYFRHLIGGHDPDSERVYRWHILKRSGPRMTAGLRTDQWKRTVEHYVISAKALFAAMAHEGFSPEYPIPVDPNGELLGGAHRLACAIALNLVGVTVQRPGGYVWAPAWDHAWFVTNGMSKTDLDRTVQDFDEISHAL